MANKHSNMPTDWTVKDTDRFFAAFEQLGPDDCWIWHRGVKGSLGYGSFSVQHRFGYSAHRLSYWLWYQEDPGSLLVCHDCPNGDNAKCVNPAHLWLGTTQGNVADRHAKGRTASGDRNGRRLHPERTSRGIARYNAGTNDAQVRQIRQMTGTSASIARQLGISVKIVYDIRQGKSWNHVK